MMREFWKKVGPLFWENTRRYVQVLVVIILIIARLSAIQVDKELIAG